MAVKGMAVFRSGGEDYTINDPNIADEFSTSKAYSKGDYVYYGGSLYKFTQNKAAGAWNGSAVQAVKLSEDMYGNYQEAKQLTSNVYQEEFSDNNGFAIDGYSRQMLSEKNITKNRFMHLNENDYTQYTIAVNSQYVYYTIPVTPGSKYIVSATSYRYIKGVIIVNSSETVIKYYPEENSETQITVVNDVLIPDNAVKMYVVDLAANHPYCYKKQPEFHLESDPSRFYGLADFSSKNPIREATAQEYTATYLINNNSDIEQHANSYYTTYELEVYPGQYYKVTSINYNNFKSAYILNSNDELVSYFPQEGSSEESFVTTMVKIPDDGVKMLVMRKKDSSFDIKKIDYSYDPLVDAVVQPDRATYLVNSNTEIAQSPNSYFTTYHVAVKPGQKYRVTSENYNNFRSAYVLDKSGSLLAYFPETGSGTLSNPTTEFEIPANGAELLVIKNKDLRFNLEQIDVVIHDIGYRSGMYNPLYKKKLVSCGDSLTSADTSGLSNLMPYGRKSYAWFVAYRNMMEYLNMGYSGETFCSTTMEDNTYKKGFSEEKYLNIPADADIVTIFYGWNDEARGPMQYKNEWCYDHYGKYYSSCTDEEKAACEEAEDWVAMFIGTESDDTCHTWYGGWNIVLGWLRENRPDAKIGVVIPYVSTEDYRTSLIGLCKKYAVSWVDAADPREWFSTGYSKDIDEGISTLLKSQFTSDTLHPNETGHERISYPYEKWIRGL